jgi:hypothetical protein
VPARFQLRPTLTVMARVMGAAWRWRPTVSQMRCATCAASSREEVGQTTENSSPPTRPMAVPAQQALQAVDHGLDHAVAGRVAEIVVDLLEVVDIEHDQRHVALRQAARGVVDHGAAVQRARQRIVRGAVFELPASSCSWRFSRFMSRSARSLRRIRRRVSRIRRS